MNNNRLSGSRISTKQMNSLMFVSLLSPIIRLFPKSSVSIGGKAAWLSPVIALPILLLLFAMMRRFMKNSSDEEGLSHMILKAVGKVPGKIVLVIFALWLIFYTGFVVKGSAERLLSSIYPNGQPGLFIVTLAAVAAWMAIGKLRSIGRLSEIFAIIIGIILLIIVVTAAFKIEVKNLLPVTIYEIDNIAIGAMPVVNVIGIGVYITFLGGAEKEKKKDNSVLVLLAVTIIGIMATTVGTLGTELIKSLQHSFFVMIRDIELVGIVERIEAAVIITWVITDLIYVTVLLKICGEIIGTVFEKENKKIYIIVSAIISLIPAMFVIDNAFSLHYLSGIIVPIINILAVFVILPLVFVVGTIRQKI